MTQQQRIMTNDESDQGFSLLKDIIDMVKNPKAIDEAYERRRKAAQLSEDEVKKASDARALIAQGDALQTLLKTREDALAKSVAEHAKATEALKVKAEEHAKAVAAKNAELDAIAKAHAAEGENLKTAKTNLAAAVVQGEADYNERDAKLVAREAALKDKEVAAKAKADALTAQEDKLKQKATRLAAEAANW